MKKIIIFFLLILNVLVVNAQEQCLTTSPEPPQWIYNKSARSLLTIRSYSLNIFVHIVRSSSGQGFDTGILSTIVNSLNSNYSDADIQFSLLGSEFIDNDYYYVNFSGKENQLLGVNSHCEAIDVYVLGESTIWTSGGYNISGMADDIPSTALIIHGDYYNTSSLPHEMGHCLGLYHTHHGTVNEGGGDLDQCAELVNGDNSLTCGDYIEDTAADPSVWSNSSCTYIGTGTDANGDEYSPDASNLMSYAYKPCRILFSELQIERMKDFIDNTAILQNVFHSTISGPSLICTSGTYSINNLPPGATVTWNESSNLIENPTGTFTANGSGEGWVEATLTPGCGEVTLPRKNVWVGRPFIQSIQGPTYVQKNLYYTYHAQPDYDFGGTYYWYLYSSSGTYTLTTSTSPQVNIYFPTEGANTLVVTAQNACGWDSMEPNLNIEVYRPWFFSLSPNPATSETVISIEQGSSEESSLKSASTETTFDENAEWDIEVYDNMQSLKLKKQKLKGNSTRINTQNWKEGVYMVRVKYNDEIITGKLIVKK